MAHLPRDLSIISTFLCLHKQDFDYFKELSLRLSTSALWEKPELGNSIANVFCHVVEMEAFWIDWGFDDKPFARNRQLEFDRGSDLDSNELHSILDERYNKTQRIVSAFPLNSLAKKKLFHGDKMNKESMLVWHIHHLGNHFGQVQILERNLKKLP